jgi:hypothetical protein
MKKYFKVIASVAFFSALAGCASAERHRIDALCANEIRGNTVYYKNFDITVEQRSDERRGESHNFNQTVSNLRKNNIERHLEWRIPTRNDMHKLHECMREDNYTHSYTVFEPLNDGTFAEHYTAYTHNYSTGAGDITLFISGGDPADQAIFNRLVDEKITPVLDKYAKQSADRDAAYWKQHTYNPLEEKQKALANIKSFAKGSILDCTSEDVVAVNWSMNRTSFVCPGVGTVSFTDLLKEHWKVLRSERTPAQAAEIVRGAVNYGVSISITVEKQ